MSKVPLCFKFRPTEKELVESFLIPKAKGLALPDGHEIQERTLYGKETAPWKVFTDKDPWQYLDDTKKKKIIYVFTKVIAKHEQINNYKVRITGCGTWQLQTSAKPIRGLSIADKRLFTFKPKKEFENETRGKWTMYEYMLKNTDDCKDGDFVVCRINCHVVKEGSGNEDDGSGSSSDAASNSLEKTRVLTMSKVPLCFKFCPTERELVEYYLIPKAKGLALPDGHEIQERSLYGEEAAPWKVFNDKDPWQYVDGTMEKKIIYVFTKVIVKNRKVRIAGCGTWHEDRVAKPIRGSSIADKRVFMFKPKKKIENEMRGKWTMHEYMLKNTDDCKDGDFVVCRISCQVEKEGLGNEDDGSGSSSDAASNSVEKTSKRKGKGKGNKRVRRGRVSTDQMGNQESGQVSTDLRLNNQEVGQVVSTDLRLNNQEIDFPCRGFTQQNENQEVVPYPAATPEDTYSSDTNGRSTPILHEFFR